MGKEERGGDIAGRHDGQIRGWQRATHTRDFMSSVDRAWLEMDELNNPMIVSAIIELQGVSSLLKLVSCIVERLLRYPRFRQRVDTDRMVPMWVEDCELDLGYHVQLRRLPDTEPEQALREAIAREMGSELDRVSPLWRITVFVAGEGDVVLLFRAHHAIADGIALMQLLLNITDSAIGNSSKALPAKSRRTARNGTGTSLISRIESARPALKRLGEWVAEDMRNPAKVVDQLREGRRAVASVLRLLTLPENNPARFRAALSGQRAVAWIGDIEFASIRRFAKAGDVKINDIFLTALAGAFRRYLQADGAVDENQNLRVSIPVNLRREHDGEFGNRFGLVMLDLPIGIEDWRTRLALVAERMVALKNSPEARAILACLAAAGRLPAPVERGLVGYLGAKTATVVSNLPGPKEELCIGGARMTRLVFWPPQSGGVGLGLSLLSYAGKVTVGVSADQHLMPDPQRLVNAFEEELSAMLTIPREVRRSNHSQLQKTALELEIQNESERSVQTAS